MLKHGYPVRLPFAQLHARFLPLLAPASPQVGKLDPSQFAELLAAVVGVRPSDCALGSSKIFLRGDAAIAFDELRFKDTQDVLVVLLIGWYVRVRYIKMRKGAILIQARVRGVAARVRGAELHRVRQMERLAARQQAAAEAAEAAKNESVKPEGV
ncbi:hypothetical protein T492DRAFT_871576 [Pavlovales sp. CCMP2436]|nr:hypothetical protein T492DRAFT_871576 [Pavlovales sp. CCMP2436]